MSLLAICFDEKRIIFKRVRITNVCKYRAAECLAGSFPYINIPSNISVHAEHIPVCDNAQETASERLK